MKFKAENKFTKFSLPPLYPITDLGLAKKTTHLDIVKELVEGGAKLIQIREKNLSSYDLFSQAMEVITYARKKGVKIIINDRVDIALAVDADGVHIGQDDLPIEEARTLLGPKKIIGLSTHNLRQAIKANASSADYISIGPIFGTATKASSNLPLGTGIIKHLRHRVTKPMVAIGGVRLDRLEDVFSVGADSVAVISDLLKYDNISERTKVYLAECLKRSSRS